MATAAGRRVDVADLANFLDDAGVDEQIQFDIALHYKTVRRFSALGDDRASVRAALLADFTLNPAEGAAVIAQVGAVVSAWEASSDFIEANTKISAVPKFSGTPRSLSAGDKLAVGKDVVTTFGRIAEKECPSNAYIASKLEDLEEGELVASSLDEIFSRADGCSAQLDLASSSDAHGRLMVTKSKPKSLMPTSTEELRMKLAVEAATWGLFPVLLPFQDNEEVALLPGPGDLACPGWCRCGFPCAIVWGHENMPCMCYYFPRCQRRPLPRPVAALQSVRGGEGSLVADVHQLLQAAGAAARGDPLSLADTP